MASKVLIIGGVAGGATAAARLRRLDEQAEIIMFERGEYISFANCGLPYYIGRTIENRDDLLLQTPEAFRKRYNVDVRVKQEVTRIDRQKKTVEVLNHADGSRYMESYDALILSPGAEPFKPPISGADSERIFKLRNIPDMDAIDRFISEKQPQRAVVVGAGYIGLEMAENLRDRGILAAVVELASSVMPTALDPEMAFYVQNQLEAKNVAVWLNDAVQSFEDTGQALKIRLKSGMLLSADLVILSVGVRPEVKLAKEAGLELGPLGGIAVNKQMQTNDPAIYAVGDAVEAEHFVLGKSALIPLAGPANKQGRIAADHICGQPAAYGGTQGTGILKVFDLTVAMTGLSETVLRKAGIEYETLYIHPAQHVGYYPGAQQMHLKVLFTRPEGKILGAQAVGHEGVDKRIDVLATAIRAGLTVYDLRDLELAYAPPYGSGKDAINMAGYVGANILDGTMPVSDARDLTADDFVLDVRTAGEFERGHAPHAVHIPVDDLRGRLDELPRSRTIHAYCGVGIRSYIAARILLQNGFDAKNINGGYLSWCAAHHKPVEDSVTNKRLKEEFGVI